MSEIIIYFFLIVCPILIAFSIVYFKKKQDPIILLYLLLIPVLSLLLVWLGRIYIYDYSLFFKYSIGIFNANLLELIFFMLAILAITGYAFIYLKETSTKFILISLVLLSPIVFNSIERLTQNAAVDEVNTIYEAVILDNSALEHWSRSAYRFTSITMGSLFTLINDGDYESHPGKSVLDLGYHKALHWFFMFLLILILHRIISKYYVIFDEKSNRKYNEVLFFSLFIGLALIIPNNLMGLRYANYDGFAMMLGLIGLFLSLASLEKNSVRLAITSLVICTVACQEKLLLAPLAILALLITTYVMYQGKHKLRYLPLFLALSVFISLGTAAVMTLIVGTARQLNFPEHLAFSVSTPLISWKIPRKLVIDPANQLNLPRLEMARYIGIVGIIVLLATLFFDYTKNIFIKIVPRISKVLVLIVSLVVLTVGIWGSYNIRTYQAWIVPPPDGIFDARYQGYLVGNEYWFDDTQTKTEHFLKNIVWYNSVFVNSVPTACWILLFISLPVIIVKRKTLRVKSDSLLDIAIIVSLIFPTFMAVNSSWLYNRYYNIFTYLLCLYTLILAFKLISIINRNRIKLAVVIVIWLGFALEVLPYRPAYGFFSPFWSNADETVRVELGRSTLRFVGWSLEHEPAQSKIYSRCKVQGNCSKIRIFNDYGGTWLGTNDNKPSWQIFNLVTQGFGVPSTIQANGYSENDYFVITRIGLYNPFGNPRERMVPPEIKPDFLIKSGRLITAWVYRGDELNRNGFSF